jgi:hypothetical protein
MPGYHNVGDVAVTDGFERVLKDFDEFCQSVEKCRAVNPPEPVDLKAAYGALNRLRERYEHEKDNLNKGERTVLKKVFEDYVFLEGLMDIRQIAEHVIKRKDAVIYTTGNAPITLQVKTSAGAMFAGSRVTVYDTSGAPHTVDHLNNLETAERRIKDGIARATQGS